MCERSKDDGGVVSAVIRPFEDFLAPWMQNKHSQQIKNRKNLIPRPEDTFLDKVKLPSIHLGRLIRIRRTQQRHNTIKAQ